MADHDPTVVAILMFEGCDLLDTGGPYEVFLTATRLAQRDGEPAPFRVETVTVDGQAVRAYGGLGLAPSAGPEVLDTADVVVVPGTIDLDSMLADTPLVAAVEACVARNDMVVTSVCTGAFLLGAAGALAEAPWTTHWEDIDLLSSSAPTPGVRGVRWVDAGKVVTSGGLSSGIAMALHLVERFASADLAQRTARQIDYDWNNASLVD